MTIDEDTTVDAVKPLAPMIEYWPELVLVNDKSIPAEVNYFAGGPSSSYWFVPNTGRNYY